MLSTRQSPTLGAHAHQRPCPWAQGVHYSLESRITCVHVPYENPPIYNLFLLKSSNIFTNIIASKYISICTQWSKNKYKNCILHVYKCLEMQKYGPIICIISNHEFLVIKSLLSG